MESGQGADWMHAWAIRRVRPFGEARYLDLGCSVGSALYLARKARWNTYGQDISQQALSAARELTGSQTFDEDLAALANRGLKFEFVSAFNLIEHLPEPLAYLKDVRRILAPGGYFAVAVPNYDSYHMRHATWDQWLPPFHINFFNLKTLTSALKAADLEIMDHRIKPISLSGFPGSRLKQLIMLPYIVSLMALRGPQGNGIVALARCA